MSKNGSVLVSGRAGLPDGDIELLFAQRASGRLPLPLLTPAEVEAAVRVTGLKALRPLAWMLLCSRELVKIRDAKTAEDWVAWGLKHAGQAESQEWANAAGTLRRNRQLVAARQTLEHAFRQGESARAWSERGTLLAETGGDSVEAEAAYSQAIALDPNSAYPWTNLGKLLEDQRRLEEAETAYTKGVELDPENAYRRRRLHELQARRSLTTAQNALKEAGWPRVRKTLSQLPTASEELATWLASPALVEELVGHALANGQGASMLDLLRELGFDRQARALLLALEARLIGDKETFADAEPETRRAAQLLFKRMGTGER